MDLQSVPFFFRTLLISIITIITNAIKVIQNPFFNVKQLLEDVIDLSDPERSIVRPIHQSVLFRPYCIQILTPHVLKYVSCYTEEEYEQWLNRYLNINQFYCAEVLKICSVKYMCRDR